MSFIDRVTPSVQRDLHFDAMAYVRRQALRDGLLVFALLTGAPFLFLHDSDLGGASRWLGAGGCLLFLAEAALREGIQAALEWRQLLTTATSDGNLSTDPRFPDEAHRASRMGGWIASLRTARYVVNAAGFAYLAIAVVVLVRRMMH
jgi:hypothetical protein